MCLRAALWCPGGGSCGHQRHEQIHAPAAMPTARRGGVDSRDFGSDWDSGIITSVSEQAAFRLGGGSYRAPGPDGGTLCSLGRLVPTLDGWSPPMPLHTRAPSLTGCSQPGWLRCSAEGSNFARKLPAYAAADAVCAAPETRRPSPSAHPRWENFQSAGLQGALPQAKGQAVQRRAAVDGMRCAGGLVGIAPCRTDSNRIRALGFGRAFFL